MLLVPGVGHGKGYRHIVYYRAFAMRAAGRIPGRDRDRSGRAGMAVIGVIGVIVACKGQSPDGQSPVDAGVARPAGPSAVERLCRSDAAACARLQAAGPEALRRAKVVREEALAAHAGRPFLCTAGLRECVASYAGLAGLDWAASRLPAGLPVLIDEDAPLGVEPRYVAFGPRADPAAVAGLLGIPTATLSMDGGGADPLGELREGAGSPPCAGSRAFYDRLFAEDEVRVTMVFGYFDQHLETLRGYVRHVLLKWDPIPVFLRSQGELADDVRARFTASGFAVESASATELRLAREFRYRGQAKTLRVRVVFSVVPCPGETPDAFGRVWRFDDQTCPAQQHATAFAKASMVDAFADSAIVMYHGHSRRGRGLDFGPMSLGDGNLRLERNALALTPEGPRQTLLFVSSCSSARYFRGAVAELRRELPAGRELSWLAVEGDVHVMNGPQTSLRLLDLLAEGKCPGDILAALNLPVHFPDPSRVVAEGF